MQTALDSPETLSAGCDELIPALQTGVRFTGNSETAKAAVKEAKSLIKFLEETKKKPPTKEEIAKAKSSLTVLLNLLEETKRQMVKDREAKEKKGEKARDSLLQANQVIRDLVLY